MGVHRPQQGRGEYIGPVLHGLLQGFSRSLPSQCRVCQRWPTAVICDDCVDAFAQPVARCETCAIAVMHGQRQCGQCVRAAPALSRCLTAVHYDYPWAKLLVDFKFREQTGLAQAMAKLLRAAPWVEASLDAADLLIPMPLSPQRLRERGFNQALVLARALHHPQLAPDLLWRVRHTPPQSSLNRKDRSHNLQGAYLPNPLQAATIRDQHIVLLDDVMTTGTSLQSAALALRQAGARSVTGVVFARTA